MGKMKRREPRRFHVGDRFKEIQVSAELPFEKRDQTRSKWWYEITCDCGEVEVVNENQLINGKQYCGKCRSKRGTRERANAKRRSEEKAAARRKFDFSRLPAPTLVPGPDSF